MAKRIDTQARIESVRLQQMFSHPSNPDGGYESLYIISGSSHGGLFVKDSAGRQIGPFITGTSSAVTMDTTDPYGIYHRLDTADADDDEFDNASIDAAFTQVNPTGVATWVEGNHVLSCAFNGQSANDLSAILKPTTLADGEAYETCVRVIAQKVATKFTMAGLVISDGTNTTSNAMALMFYMDFDNNRCSIDMWKGTLTNISTAGTNITFGYTMANDPIRLKILRNSSTSFSPLIGTRDGAQFNAFGASVMDPGFTPTHAGLFVSVWGSGKAGLASFDYFRVTA